MTKFEGITVNLGGQDYVIPGLNLKMVKRLTTSLKLLSDGDPTEQLNLMVEIIHGAMVRNYPDLTPAFLEDVLDSNTVPVVFQAILKQSGFGTSAGPKAVAP